MVDSTDTMNSNIATIHIGEEIKKVFDKRGLTKEKFAEMINCHRTNVYDIFSRKTIDIELLIRISNALDYDFIHKFYYPRHSEYMGMQPIILTIQIDQLQFMELMDKYKLQWMANMDETQNDHLL